MYLAEAIREKEFIDDSISLLGNRIKGLSVSTDINDVKLNKELTKNKVKELENLYKEFQKYSIIVSRAKAITKIKLNDDDFSIADAEHILKTMRTKLGYIERLIEIAETGTFGPPTYICLDTEDLIIRVNQLRSDIKTIENSIERSTWATEV